MGLTHSQKSKTKEIKLLKENVSFILSKSSFKMSTSKSDRMAKLKELHKKRQEARQLNHAEVVEEDRRSKEPKNMESRRRKAQYILEEEKMRAECEAQGKDFEREKLKHVSFDDAEATDRRKRAKANPDKGFSSYEDAAFRKYNTQMKSIKPNLE